jgi:hypothetical protein
MRKPGFIFWLPLALLPVMPAHAYIGPGVGTGTVAVVLGILSSIFFAFVGIIWYPIKRLIKGRKPPAKTPEPAAKDASASGEPE